MSSRKVLENSMYYMVAAMLPMAVNFLLLPVYTRFLTPADYGILALTQLLAAFLPVAISLQIHSAMARFYFEFQGSKLKTLTSTIFFTLAVAGTAALLLLLIFSKPIIAFIFPNIPADKLILFQVVMVAAFFNCLAEFSRTLLRVTQQARRFMTISLVLFVAAVAASLIEVVVLRRGAYGMVEAGLIASVLASLLFFLSTRGHFALSYDHKMLSGPLRYSMPMIPHALAGIVFMYSDRVILAWYVPLSAIGLYALADRIAALFKTLVNQLNAAFQPHFIQTAGQDKSLAVKHARDISRTVTFLTSLAIGCIALFSVELVYYLLDRKYFEAWRMIPLLASAYCFRSLYCFASSGLFFEKKTATVAVITVIAAAINIGINLVFMPAYGVIVAVYSTMAAFAASWLLTMLLSRRTFFVGLDNVANLSCLAYMYSTILLAIHINGRFTLDNPHLPALVYLIKITVIAAGLLLGYWLKLFNGSSIRRAFEKQE